MAQYEQLQKEIANGFRRTFGRCGVYIYRPISPIGCIFHIIDLFLQHNPKRSIFIVTNTSIECDEIKYMVGGSFPTNYISVTTKNYFNGYHYTITDLMITVNIYDNNDLERMINNPNIRFYLSIFDKRDIKDKECTRREALMPFIQVSTSIRSIVEESIHSPVKETMIGVDLTPAERIDYKAYNDYITESMKIFGDFETLTRAREGDKVMNYSYQYVCNVIAKNNGWNEEIDTTTDYGKSIDNLYNPNAIHERACLMFNHSRSRKDIVVDAETKLIEIAKICDENKHKKIIIVSSSGQFATRVTDYLNKMNQAPDDSYVDICANYHNDLEDKVYVDKKGNTVLYKTGEKKGQPKVIGWKKQCSLAMEDFNKSYVNILSIKGSSDMSLCVDCDLVIFTSPLITNVYDFRRRFSQVMFRSKPFDCYTIYCKDTIEQNTVDKREESPMYEIVRDNVNFYISD